MVKYIKQTKGRLTLVQKGLLNNVNELVRKLPDDQQKKFNITVNNDADLQKLFETLSSGSHEDFEIKGANPDSMRSNVESIEDETLSSLPKENIKESINKPNMSEIPNNFSPLAKPTVERSYNQSGVQQNAEPIPEPNFNGPASGNDNVVNNQSGSSDGYSNPQPASQEPTAFQNVAEESVNGLDDKEKKFASKQLVNAALDAYEMLHTVATNFVIVDEAKLNQKIIQGELDPTITFPVDDQGTRMNAIEFFQNSNESAKEALAYDPEFGEKVRPAMERLFMKKGIGLKDEHFLMYMFGKDIAMKGSMMIGLRKSNNMMMGMFAEMKQMAAMNQSQEEENISRVQPDNITHPREDSHDKSDTSEEPEIVDAETIEDQFEE